MTGFRAFSLACLLLFSSLVVATPASAQQVGNVSLNDVDVGVEDATDEPTDDSPAPDACDESVDNNTWICRADLNDETATVVLWTDELQSVTLTDAGGLIGGGEIYQQDERLRPNRRTRIVMPVTMKDGFAGVSIDTPDVLYGVPLERDAQFLPGSPQTEDPAVAAITMFLLFAMAFPVCYVGLRRYTGGVTDEL